MNEPLFELTPPENLGDETLESYQALKDLVDLHQLDPEKILTFLAKIYQNEKTKLQDTFESVEMPAVLGFSYQLRIRDLERLVRKCLAARELYFTKLPSEAGFIASAVTGGATGTEAFQ